MDKLKNLEEIKKTLVYLHQKCRKSDGKLCCVGKCPFWDKDLDCRLNGPCNWWIDDWKEK